MSMMKGVFIVTALAAGLFAAGEQLIQHFPLNKVHAYHPAAADRLYVPEAYEQQLSKLHFFEVAALPYFSSSFICIAKNAQGQQVAVVFKTANELKTVKLPLTYEQIAQRIRDLGYDIKNIGNLHMFEINNRLVWSFSEAETQIYMELDGRINKDPFRKSRQ